MDISKAREILLESKHQDRLNELVINLPFPHLHKEEKLTGIINILTYFNSESSAWLGVESVPSDLKSSKDFFVATNEILESFIQDSVDKNLKFLNEEWRIIQSKIKQDSTPRYVDTPHSDIFPFSSEYTQYLLEVASNPETKDFFNGVFDFFKRFKRNKSPYKNEYSYFVGHSMGYSFEKELLGKTEFSDTSYSKKVLRDKMQIFDESIKDAELKTSKMLSNITKLEKTYDELLRLKKPANYWKDRSIKLKKEGRKSLYLLIGLILLACTTLFALLWLTPEGMIKSFNKDAASAIRWSVILITFISFLIFGIRILNRIVFSSFHLSRDAEEREHLTYLYLSLIREADSSISVEERRLIMQSLFSRADTGLIKEDSSPAMPNDIFSKILGK